MKIKLLSKRCIFSTGVILVLLTFNNSSADDEMITGREETMVESGEPNAQVIDNIVITDNFMEEVKELDKEIDKDDLLLVNIDCQGKGYLSYNSQQGSNSKQTEFEFSVLSGKGIRVVKDQHTGLGEWLVYWDPEGKIINRWKFLSHYEEVYIEGIGIIADDDEDIDKFIDYTLGDYNKDGIIDELSGEVWDYDGDGIPPYDRKTDVFDEDDWGDIDGFENGFSKTHPPTIDIPFKIFDYNLDNSENLKNDSVKKEVR